MFKQDQTFTLTTDDQQTLTYRIQTITQDGRLLVHSSLLEQSYFISQKAFRDFLRFIGVVLEEEQPALYRIYLVNFGWYTDHEHETFNLAINAGKKMGYEFRIELGDMVCATWSYFSGLRVTTEYQRWAEDQERALCQVAGEAL